LNCATLTNVTIGANVIDIGNWAFASCTLTNVLIPDSVRNLGDEAFNDCESLQSLTLGSGVKSIGDEVFFHCISLTNIAVNPGNPAYSGIGGVLFNQDQTTLVQWPDGVAGTYAIPNGVVSIRHDAFNSCNVTNVLIPDSVVSI